METKDELSPPDNEESVSKAASSLTVDTIATLDHSSKYSPIIHEPCFFKDLGLFHTSAVTTLLWKKMLDF